MTFCAIILRLLLGGKKDVTGVVLFQNLIMGLDPSSLRCSNIVYALSSYTDGQWYNLFLVILETCSRSLLAYLGWGLLHDILLCMQAKIAIAFGARKVTLIEMPTPVLN